MKMIRLVSTAVFLLWAIIHSVFLAQTYYRKTDQADRKIKKLFKNISFVADDH